MADNFESMSFADQLANTLPFQAGAASLQDQLAAAQAREAELMADIARLREELNTVYKLYPDLVAVMAPSALAATPEQSLARLRNQAIEKCAVELDGHWDMAAGIIRAMKETE